MALVLWKSIYIECMDEEEVVKDIGSEYLSDPELRLKAGEDDVQYLRRVSPKLAEVTVLRFMAGDKSAKMTVQEILTAPYKDKLRLTGLQSKGTSGVQIEGSGQTVRDLISEAVRGNIPLSHLQEVASGIQRN